MTEQHRFSGASVRRLEDHRFITGHGRYLADMEFDGLLHAAFVRSDQAHAMIVGVDAEDARNAPGVRAVFLADDLNIGDLPSEVDPVPVVGMARPALARDRVRFVGEAVAIVIADTEEQAVDAAGLVWVDLDPLPVVIDPVEALTAPAIHDRPDGNIAARSSIGTPPDAWNHDVDVTVTVVNQRLAPVPIETMAAVADPTVRPHRLHVGHQAPHRLKKDLVAVLGMDLDVVVPDVGGGFGLKARTYPEYHVLIAAAEKLGRPVRWLQTRREHLSTGAHGRDMVHTVRLAGSADGRFERIHIDIVSSTGAYPYIGSQVVSFTQLTAQGPYDIPELTLASTTVATNAAPTAPYRGAGRPEAAYALERAIDAFARAAKLDPADVRRVNFVSEFPYLTKTGALYDSGDYRAALDEAVRLVKLDDVRAEQAHRLGRGQNPIGVGFGAFVERAGGPADSSEYARVDVTPDGRVEVRTGTTSNGQGHETVWAQVASDVFDVPIDQIDVIAGDTSRVARGFGSTASRSAQIGASGIWRVSWVLRERAQAIAAEILEAASEDIELTDGVFRVLGVPGSEVSLAEVAARAENGGDPLTDEEWYSPGAQTFPYGVHAAVVEVLLETGEVRVRDLVAVDDTGNLLNPMIVEGQTHGSLAQGLGQAMYEAVRYGSEGQLLSSTLMDYVLPRADDVPSIVTGRVISPAPSNPLGVKGAGEGGCIGGPPAIVNAALDALAPYGVDHLEMPLRPESVWKALEQAKTRAS